MQRRALLVFATTLLCLAVPAVAGAHAPGSRTVPAAGQVAPGAGLVTIPSAYGLTETLARLEQAIQGGGSTVVARVDHAANARRVGKALRPTTLLIFGNPNLGTELMQSAQTSGIDLPQKFLVWEDARGQVYVSYTATEYLAARHGITDRDAVVQMIAVALGRLATTATAFSGSLPTPVAQPLVAEGLVTTRSAATVEETLARLEQAIQGGGSTVVARVDHAANARRVGKMLPPTTLLIFGNPNLGTELMQTNQTAGIDLPQKLLVWQDAAGQVYVTYNAPQFIAARHGITDRDPVVQMITTALARLVATATATTPGMPNTGGGSLHPASPSGLQLALLLGGLGAGAAVARGRRRRAA